MDPGSKGARHQEHLHSCKNVFKLHCYNTGFPFAQKIRAMHQPPVLGQDCSARRVSPSWQQPCFLALSHPIIVIVDPALCKSSERVRMWDYMSTALQNFGGRQMESLAGRNYPCWELNIILLWRIELQWFRSVWAHWVGGLTCFSIIVTTSHASLIHVYFPDRGLQLGLWDGIYLLVALLLIFHCAALQISPKPTFSAEVWKARPSCTSSSFYNTEIQSGLGVLRLSQGQVR